jgi:hypothetical protein
VSFREPMFLITDGAGTLLGALAVEDGRWVGRDTRGRQLFNRKDLTGAARATRRIGVLVSSAWWDIRATRPGQTRSERIRHDRRGLPYITEPWPVYVTPCCTATATITVDDGGCAAGPATRPWTPAWRGTPTSPTPPTRSNPGTRTLHAAQAHRHIPAQPDRAGQPPAAATGAVPQLRQPRRRAARPP